MKKKKINSEKVYAFIGKLTINFLALLLIGGIYSAMFIYGFMNMTVYR